MHKGEIYFIESFKLFPINSHENSKLLELKSPWLHTFNEGGDFKKLFEVKSRV